MQSLLGGADCSTSSNPLKQVIQREGVDNSLFKDRMASTSNQGSNSLSAFRPGFHPQAGPASGLHANPTPHPFNLSHLSAALAQDQGAHNFDAQWDQAHSNGHQIAGAQRFSSLQHQQLHAVPRQASPAAMPMQQWQGPPSLQSSSSSWSGDFQSFTNNNAGGKGKHRAIEAPPSNPTHQISQAQQYRSNGYQPYQPSFQPMYSGGVGVGMPGLGLQSYESNMNGQLYAAQGQAQGQSQSTRPEMSQKDMDDLFARAEEDWKAADGDGVQKKGQEQTDANGDGDAETFKDAQGDYEAVWQSLRPEAERLNKLAEWENDFSQFTNDEDDLFEVLNESLNQPGVGQSSFDDQFSEMGLGGQGYEGLFESDDGVPRLRAYEFATQNHRDSLAPASAWAEANRLLASGGSLSDAALLIESFIRRATAEDHAQAGVSNVEAWSTLGRVHAMDEKEDKALSAFEQGRRALEGDGDAGRGEGVAGEMLTNLAISYVNESLDLAALTTLHQFLRLLHPTHASTAPAPSRSAMADNLSPWALHQNMTDSFLSLAREQWNNKGVVDPDVQVGLGTLYYMMGEYGEARGCWTAALGERPDDYLLWNRLGATLANGGSSEEAVDAYRRALELKPTFTRAIFNLGVACLNIGVHREAAEHFLAALSLHPAQSGSRGQSDPSGGPPDPTGIYDSGSLWSTLRRALIALEMPELAERAKPGTDLGVFRQAGFEF